MSQQANNEARTRYAKALALYRKAEAATYGSRSTGREFQNRCEDMLTWDEYRAGLRSRDDFSPPRDPSPAMWADAAERVTRDYLDTYTVRNTLNSTVDWEWEQMEKAAGRW